MSECGKAVRWVERMSPVGYRSTSSAPSRWVSVRSFSGDEAVNVEFYSVPVLCVLEKDHDGKCREADTVLAQLGKLA